MTKIINPLLTGSLLKQDMEVNNKNKLKQKEKKNSKINIEHNIFTDVLNQVENDLIREELLDSFEEIVSLGKELVISPNFQKLEEYKKNVSKLLKNILKKMYKVESKEGLPRLGQPQKVYINISKIDEELEKLTNDFLKKQVKEMELIKTIEGIQGLIYNVIV